MDEYRLELRVDAQGRHEWIDSTGKTLNDTDPLTEKLGVYLPPSLHSELSLLAVLTGRTMSAMAGHIICNYLRPGLMPPLLYESVEDLLRRRAEALLNPQIPKPRSIINRNIQDPTPSQGCLKIPPTD